MTQPLHKNPLGLATIAFTCGTFWALVAFGIAHAETPRHQLDRINDRINSRMVYGRDGDCKSFAEAKYLALAAEGWPASDLRLIDVTTELDQPHRVVEADIDGTAWILDNRFAWPETWPVLVRYGYRLGIAPPP